jgi:hypothetical protein
MQPPPSQPSASSSRHRLPAFAAHAGLTPREVIEGEAHWTYPDLATALRGLNSSGVAIRAAGLVGEDVVSAAHAAALEPFRQPDCSLRIGARYTALIATA